MKSGLLPFILSAVALSVHAATPNPEAVWDTITPSTNLTWVPCYSQGFQCARFTVPLDYTKSTNGTMAIALIRLPSSLSKGDKDYRGPVLFNPGGPGGSGVDWVLSSGAAFQEILGNQYDIVGFDPRGVERTTPALRGFTDTEELMTFSIKFEDDPPLGATPDALARTYARTASYGAVAQSRLKDVAPYVNTPFMARDMLAITQAHGFDKLKYWGVSYGTILGMTFSSMFPDKVERVVVDGVVDAPDYYTGEWSTNLQDTDKDIGFFYKSCAEAGPDECAIYEKTADGVKARVEKLYDTLKHQPIPVVTGTGPQDYGIIDYGMVRRTVFDFLYQPFSIGGKNTSILLAQLEKGDGSLFWSSQLDSRNFLQCSCDENVHQDTTGFGALASFAIGCGDGYPVNDTLPALQKWFENNQKLSSFADVWPFRVQCAGWKLPPAEKFDGAKTGGNTSFPLLFIGNTADPVTPLASAKKMSKLFNNSVLLTVDTPGHTSFAATSTCNALAVRAYFNDGILPKPGTICDIESKLFSNDTSSSVSSRDADLSSTLRELTKSVTVPRFGRFRV